MKNYLLFFATILVFALAVSGCVQMQTQEDELPPIEDTQTDTQDDPKPDEEVFKTDNFIVDSPNANSKISSPIEITGSAKGTMYFEGSFEIKILDENENELGKGPATAQSDWMTENFVPFKATITFNKPVTKSGFVLLKKDNPSGLPENDLEVKMPVTF